VIIFSDNSSVGNRDDPIGGREKMNDWISCLGSKEQFYQVLDYFTEIDR